MIIIFNIPMEILISTRKWRNGGRRAIDKIVPNDIGI